MLSHINGYSECNITSRMCFLYLVVIEDLSTIKSVGAGIQAASETQRLTNSQRPDGCTKHRSCKPATILRTRV